ncbi:MAG: hypothetical protein G01um101456_105 [Parcubacteria group bacterium Gr01-1014_56]|nr:MAG: hypothetical protein G01um101456_105 [Parcubacteria group bacterium Gr01-1014_56]
MWNDLLKAAVAILASGVLAVTPPLIMLFWERNSRGAAIFRSGQSDEALELTESSKKKIARNRMRVAIFGVGSSIFGAILALTTALVGNLSLKDHRAIFLFGLGILLIGIFIVGVQIFLKLRRNKSL